jgi:general secretion pathway protein J
MPRADAARYAGFTLVEVMVAVAIMALVATIAWRGTAAMTDAEAKLSTESARWQQLDALVARLEGDVRLALPRAARLGASREAAWTSVDDAQGNTTLLFTRAGPEALDEPGVGGQRVGYRLHDGRIEVSYWPHVDNVATAAPATYALVDGIARFRVLNLTKEAQFSDRWPLPGETPLPRALRVEITLADGSVIERWLTLS